MGLHPFALQNCFRCAAAELLKYPENEMTIFFGKLRVYACSVGWWLSCRNEICWWQAVLCFRCVCGSGVQDRAVKCSTRQRPLYLISSVTTLRSVPSCLCTDEQPCLTITGEALESLLLRNDFVDAQVLSAIWPVEFDRYKVPNVQCALCILPRCVM
jgi:hypothetical protein